MFGCIGRIVAVALGLVVGAAAYLTRGSWEPMLREKLGLQDRKSTRLNSSHIQKSRMPSSA